MSHCGEILTVLRGGGTITPIDALRDFGCFRLAARIYDLRQKGYQIEKATLTGNSYATYYLKR